MGRQIEAAIETVLELVKVARYLFFPNRMEGGCQRSLDVAEDGVYPAECGVLRGLAATAGHNRHVLAAGSCHRRKAGQPVGEDDRTRPQAVSGIARNLPLPETAYTTQVHFYRPAILRRLNGSDERGLVVRAPRPRLPGIYADRGGPCQFPYTLHV